MLPESLIRINRPLRPHKIHPGLHLLHGVGANRAIRNSPAEALEGLGSPARTAVHREVKDRRSKPWRDRGKLITAHLVPVALAVDRLQMIIRNAPKLILHGRAPQVIRIGLHGDTLHGGTARIFWVIRPAALVVQGVGEDFGEVAHGSTLYDVHNA